MKIEVQQQGQQRVRVEGRIEADEVRKERMRLGREYAGRVSIPGFRPGKAPVDLVIRRLGDEFDQEVRDHLVQEALDTAMKDHSLHPSTALDPDVRGPAEDGSYSFTVEFETFPHIEVKDYLGVEVEEPALPPVDDTLVEGSLDSLRDRLARFEAKGEEATGHEGDIAVCQVALLDPATGSPLIDPFETRIQVGLDDEPVADAARSLLGQKVGDAVEVEGTIGRITARRLPEIPAKETPAETAPEGDAPKEEAEAPKPRTVKARIEVRQLLERRVPAADDDLARRLGHPDLASLKADLRKRLEEERQAERKNRILESVLLKLEQNHPIDLGEQTVEKAIADENRRILLKALGPSNLHLADQLSGIELPREKTEPAARKSLHRAWIIENIARQEHIEVTTQDVAEEIGRMSEETRQPAEEIYRFYTQNRTRQQELFTQVRIRKVLDLLTRYAVVQAPRPATPEPDGNPAAPEVPPDPVTEAAGSPEAPETAPEGNASTETAP
jgi:trigger factor